MGKTACTCCRFFRPSPEALNQRLRGLPGLTYAALEQHLNELYACSCTPNLADEPEDDFINQLALALAQGIHKTRGSGQRLDARLAMAYAEKLWSGGTEGYGKELHQVDWDTPDAEMLRSIARNTYQFAAAKTKQQLRDLNRALLNEKGKLRSWQEFKAEALLINGTHSRWLKAEYDMAVASSQMAAKWVRAQEDKDAMPLLQFDAVMDKRTTQTCRSLDGVVRPVDDPFWNTWYPPNHWGCRSDVRSLAGGPVTDMDKVITPDIPVPFQTNLAKSGWLFPADHPYWEGMTDADKIAALAPMPYDYQFNMLAKAGKGRLRQHVAVNESTPDYVHVRNIAGEKTDLGLRVDILPELEEKSLARPVIYHDGKPRKNPDLRINGVLWEVKTPEVFDRKSISDAIKRAAKQADHVILYLTQPVPTRMLREVINGRFKTHEALQIVEVYYQGRFIPFRRP